MFKNTFSAIKLLAITNVMASLLASCATSEKITAVQIGDTQLSCNALKDESAKLDKAERQISDKKGVTGTNVAAALFWIPGLIYTYYDASEATRLLNERRSHLNTLYNQKGCQ